MTKQKPDQGPSSNAKPARRAYEPPTISFTEVEVEAALMGLCKTTGGGGIPTGCSLPCQSPSS